MKFNILTQIFIAFVVAILLGALVGEQMTIVEPLGELFLRLIQFIIVPLVLSSLVVGVASTGDMKQLGRMGGKTVVYYLITTAVAITIGLTAGNLFSPGEGLNITLPEEEAGATAEETPSIVDTLLNIVPTNPIEGLTQGNMLQIIFFAIFLGLGITMVGEKGKLVYQFFDQLAEIMYKITGIIMKFAPIGVFGLVAPTVGTYGVDVLLPLLKVILTFFVACVFHLLFTYSIALKALGRMSPVTFFKGITPASLVGLSTSSSAGTLPVTVKCTEENLKVSRKTSSFVLPLGATINMDGTALYQGVCILFIAQFFGLDLSFAEQLMVILTATLASIGTAGVPGAGLIMLTMVMTSINMPLEGLALVAGIDRILDMIRTSVNVTGDATAAVIVDSSEKKKGRVDEKKTA